MKHWIAAGVVIVLAACFGPGNAFANSPGNDNGSTPVVPAVHHSSTTTTAAPHFSNSSMSHSPSVPAYRPVVSSQGGLRTLNYPPVGNSVLLHRQLNPNANRVGPNALTNGYALQRPGNLRSAGNSNPLTRNRIDPQTSARLRNWNGKIDSTSQARLNHIDNCQHHHDHSWWRNHCLAIIFFDFGWWGWYDGWWYPAWGYDPYSYYEYNEPIYGYDGLSPDQIVADVQTALQERGYYQWAVDGQMGPLTRAAIARYQRDHLLPITSGIDPATLGSLGIIR